MLQIVQITAPIFIIIFAAAFLKKIGYIQNNWEETLNQYAFTIGLPALIFTALVQTDFSFKEQFVLMAIHTSYAIFALLIAIVLGKALHLSKQIHLTFFLCVIFNNTAYLGIPIIQSVYGDAFIVETAIIIGAYLFTIFTFGIGYMDYYNNGDVNNIRKSIQANILKNPLFIAIATGVICNIMQLQLPAPLLDALIMISYSATPVILVVVGLFIGATTTGSLNEWWPVLLMCLITLVLTPGILHVILTLMRYDQANASISVLTVAMPLAITPFAVSDYYNLNKLFIARSIVLSTVLSMITLPIWIYIVDY